MGAVVAARRDVAQQRHEKAKRRTDKFEELVAAVYEFDHWLDGVRERDAFGIRPDVPVTVSPFAKVQAISAVYFPQFSGLVDELGVAATQYRVWIHTTEEKRVTKQDFTFDGFEEVLRPYQDKRDRYWAPGKRHPVRRVAYIWAGLTSILSPNSSHDIAMLHWISVFAAGAMVALSIFFVFRPHHPLSGIQPPRQALAATGCVDRPETSAIPAEYSCEKP